MKRYERYKDSGVQWIGEIPEHWGCAKIRRLLRERVEKSEDGIGEPLSMSQKYGLIPTAQMGTIPNVATSYVGAKRTYNGDLVLNKLKAHLGVFALSSYDGLVSPDYAVYYATGLADLEYLQYLFKTPLYVSEFIKKTTGVAIGFNRLYTDDLFSISAHYPPLSEQHAIVDYLKDKTHKIDEYVAARERERELLESLKQSEIANVVTKGLNPNVPMKDSGIPWIGMIPEHWEVKRAKFMFNKEKREVRECDEVITCFRDGQVTLRKNRRTTGFTESFTEIGYQGVRKGDLVIHQMDAFAGSIGVSDSDGKGTSVYHCCTPKGDYDVHYYAFLIRRMAGSGFIQSLYRGIRERSSDFKYPVFGNQYLIVPPLSEQQAIVTYIDEKLSKIDRCLADLQAEIDYLKEFKQRLISDVVTGQICVAEPQKGDK